MALLDLAELLAAPDDDVVPMLCGLDAAARSDLARQVDTVYGTGRALTDRERRRLTLCRLATVPPASTVESLPRDGESLRVAVARGRRHVQAVADAGVRWMAEVAELGWVFLGVRELERHGGVTLAADDDYVLGVIGSFIDAGWWAGSPTAGRYEPVVRTSERLCADPELLEKVFWRLFEVDRDRSPSLAGTDRLLSGPGATWREAVLDLIAAGWADRARVLDGTVRALGRATSGFRAGWFVGLHRELAVTPDEAGARIDAYDLMLRSSIGPVVTVGLDALGAAGKPVVAPNLPAAIRFPGKAVALKALRLGGAALAVEGIDHPHPDVRALAARLLGRSVPPPVVRSMSLVPSETSSPGGPLSDGASRPDGASLSGGPSLAGGPLSPVGLPLGDGSLSTGGLPPPLVPVTAIVGHGELGEAMAVLVEHPADADLAERVLCAAARLGPGGSGLATIVRRVERLVADMPVEGELLATYGRVIAAAAGQRKFGGGRVPVKAALLAARAGEIADGVLAGERYAPLAEPTHEGGWIDPRILVTRPAVANPKPADAVAALLRLGPDPAATGPALAADVPGPFGAALRHALGGPRPSTVDAGDEPLWAAAGSARGFEGVVPELVAQLLGRGRIGFRASPFGRPPVPGPLSPTVALGAFDYRDRLVVPAWWAWIAAMWPGNVEAPAALALLQWPAGEYGRIGGAAALRPLLGARTVLPPVARILVAAVLGAERRSDRVAAADAVLDLMPGRLRPDDLGAAMVFLAPEMPLQRWADSLRSVAEAGRSAEVAAVLTVLLPCLEHGRSGLFALVELLAETSGPPAEGSLRTWLSGLTGTGRAARAARVLSPIRDDGAVPPVC